MSNLFNPTGKNMLKISKILPRLRRGGRKFNSPRTSHESNEVVGTARTGYFSAPNNKGFHMDTVAQRLGMENSLEMYPNEAYSLESPPKIFHISLRKGFFPGDEIGNVKKSQLKKMGLSHGDSWSICMNTAQNNDLLFSLKRHVKVQPLIFINGEPENLNDISPDQISIDAYGNCEILDENHQIVQASKNIKNDGYRRCAGCIEDECEDIGMCRKLHWSSLNTPLKRVRDQLGVYKLSDEVILRHEEQRKGTLERSNVGVNNDVQQEDDDDLSMKILSRL